MKFGIHQAFGIKNWEGNDLKERIRKASEKDKNQYPQMIRQRQEHASKKDKN